jgi:phosphoglycolate phosphatase-like HAD superfamily hydrolase
VRHVVWDWNGTLLVDQRQVLAGVNAALAAVGASPITMPTYRRVPKRPVRPFYEQLVDRQLTDDEWRLVDETYHQAYGARVDEAALAADARTVLAAAAGRYSQSLLSMWPHADLVPLVDRHGISGFFNRIDGYLGECGGEKAEHFAEHLVALREHGVRAADVVAVGDTVDDAVAARLCGAQFVLLESDTYDRERLQREGGPVGDSLTEALRLIDVLTDAVVTVVPTTQ